MYEVTALVGGGGEKTETNREVGGWYQFDEPESCILSRAWLDKRWAHLGDTIQVFARAQRKIPIIRYFVLWLPLPLLPGD